jgi:hypothetical protein
MAISTQAKNMVVSEGLDRVSEDVKQPCARSKTRALAPDRANAQHQKKRKKRLRLIQKVDVAKNAENLNGS